MIHLNINMMTEQEQIDVIKGDPYKIIEIVNPSEEVQLAAIKDFVHVFKKIKNPTKKVKMTAIQIFPGSIGYMENPDEELQLLAVSTKGIAIQYIENPSESVQIAAIEEIPYAVEYIKKPTKKAVVESFARMCEINGNKENFLYMFEHDPFMTSLDIGNKKEFLQHLLEYREELQNTRYFQLLATYICDIRKTWIQGYINVLSPLTKEQQQVWNELRLQTLY